MKRLFCTIAVVLAGAGCAGAPVGIDVDSGTSGNQLADGGSDQDSGLTDSGHQRSVDAGTPELLDSGHIETPDSGPETMPDSGPVEPADAGPIEIPDAGNGNDLGDSVPNSAPTCTSGITWLLFDWGTDLMHPGRACVACHSTHGGAPHYTFAGTVYPSTHEPDDCNGSSGGSAIKVVITDAVGKQITLSPNAVGSFHSSESFTAPYTAQVIANGRTREMYDPQTNGDCNSCHTQNGTSGAPGRIVAP